MSAHPTQHPVSKNVISENQASDWLSDCKYKKNFTKKISPEIMTQKKYQLPQCGALWECNYELCVNAALLLQPRLDFLKLKCRNIHLFLLAQAVQLLTQG